MNDYQIHYVYYHQDPRTEEIVYVGHGSYERAWICRSTGPGRSLEHAEWCRQLLELGYTPNEWVHIHEQGLSKSAAKELEQIKIKYELPKFNKPMGVPTKLNREQKYSAERYRSEFMTYREIGAILGVSAMTVWRSLNG